MIIIDIEIYSFRDKEYIIHEALVDTGAGFCAVTKHLSEALDSPLMGEKIHLWQARDPLGLEKTQLRLRYNDNVYDTGRNAQRERVSSGMYFYTIKAGNFIATNKLAIVK